MSNNFFDKQVRLFKALDPIHIGTGGYRMDRVDNSILRDVDDIPKIPGTSISGAVRSYAAMAEDKITCGGTGTCDDEDCPVCHTFGFTKDSKSIKGLVSFYDALILLYPVSTMAGPVWITTIDRINNFLLELGLESISDYPSLGDNNYFPLEEGIVSANGLNLGWLLLDEAKDKKHSTLTEKIAKFKTNTKEHLDSKILDRIVIVNNKVFKQVVNDNLEIRTSVAIDPMTGAAEEGALFTYEAIPRTTIFSSVTVISNPSYFANNIENMDKAKNIVKSGFQYLEHLGLGGMSTRGFGRMTHSSISVKKEEESKDE